MQLAKQSTDNDESLSPAINASLVDSLFQGVLPTFFGMVSTTIAAVLTAIKTGSLWLWPCALLIVVAGIARSLQMHRYEFERRSGSLTIRQARWWEPRYRAGADCYAATLGLWCFAVLSVSTDPVAHLLCCSVTIGYTAASVGRNYGRPSITQRHILLTCGPLSIGLALHGDAYYAGLGSLLVLFFLGLKYINQIGRASCRERV